MERAKLCLKVPLRDAQKAKTDLVRRGLLDNAYVCAKDIGYIYFPVVRRFASGYGFARKKCVKKDIRTGLKGTLAEKFGKEELEMLRSSMDVMGNIAILEVPDALTKREVEIAEELIRQNKVINTVLKKGKHEGVFRTQELRHLAGIPTKEATYKENNITLKLDVEKVYFSPRLSNERKRIMNQVRQGEKVLVMFSGCGPYVCVIAKNTPASLVDGVEINPVGHEYAVLNLKLNKLKNARVFCGDAKEVVPRLMETYDRIIMPLPKSAADYLGTALSVAASGAIIHFYDFQKEDEADNSVRKIMQACKASGRDCEILGIFKTGQHSPRAYRFCVDFRVK
jgi:tRNA (guanine37-N1)-methyltransferase